jgi:acetyltransferase-like isoleucine patch superfamily enzyme
MVVPNPLKKGLWSISIMTEQNEKGDSIDKLHQELRLLESRLREEIRSKYKRSVSFGDLVVDRWERAKNYGFGDGSSCYDNVLILGNVRVGKHTWIGPNVILDGSGDLEIGDYCSISAGVQIYTHNSIEWARSLGVEPLSYKPTIIGSGVYIGPQTVIQMGITIGEKSVIGAMSFINRDIPAGSQAWGIPATIHSKKE